MICILLEPLLALSLCHSQLKEILVNTHDGKFYRSPILIKKQDLGSLDSKEEHFSLRIFVYFWKELMEEAGLVCSGTCSKRCLKRLESGSKCHWLEMCLFFLIWWMAYLEGGGRSRDMASALSWQVLEWNSEIRVKAGGFGVGREWGRELLSLTLISGDDASSWIRVMTYSWLSTALSVVRAESFLLYLPQPSVRFPVHTAQHWEITFLCAGPVTDSWGLFTTSKTEAERRKKREMRRGENVVKKWKVRNGKRDVWKDKAEMYKEREEEVYLWEPAERSNNPPAPLQQRRRPREKAVRTLLPELLVAIHFNCWFSLPKPPLPSSTFLWIIITIPEISSLSSADQGPKERLINGQLFPDSYTNIKTLGIIEQIMLNDYLSVPYALPGRSGSAHEANYFLVQVLIIISVYWVLAVCQVLC